MKLNHREVSTTGRVDIIIVLCLIDKLDFSSLPGDTILAWVPSGKGEQRIFT